MMKLFLLAFFTYLCITINADEPVEEMRFTCELLGDEVALPKKELYAAIEKVLYERIKQNDDVQQSLSASTTLFHTFCPDEEPRKAALETIGKYVRNLIEQPNDEKFLRIRMGNKVFEEKVWPVKGAIEFLGAIGFRMEKSVPAVMQLTDGTIATVISNEPYLVMSPPDASVVQELSKQLENALVQLEGGKPIQFNLFRNAKLIKPNENVQQPKLTKGYCWIRVKFLYGYVVQGIFHETEKFSNVRAFVAQHISFKHGMFNLIPAVPPQKVGRKPLREENNTIKDYGKLLLNFRRISDQFFYFIKFDKSTQNANYQCLSAELKNEQSLCKPMITDKFNTNPNPDNFVSVNLSPHKKKSNLFY